VRRLRGIVLAIGCALAGCSTADPCAGITDAACISVTVRSSTISQIDSLDVRLLGVTHSSTGKRGALPVRFALVPPQTAAGTTDLLVTAYLNGSAVASGKTPVSVDPGRRQVDVVLDQAVPDLGTSDQAPCGADSDKLNCGSCGHDCTKLPNVANADQVACMNGVCAVPSAACKSGFGHCSSNPDDGCEADFSQPAHCGGCTACPSTLSLCSSSSGTFSCQSSCVAPTPDQCGSSCVSLQSDAQHCSTCNNACSFPHASASCSGATCQMGGCDPDYADCLNGPSDGCEAHLIDSDTNCGSCGFACKLGQHCSGSTCAEVSLTCSSPGITCAQSACYEAGRYSISKNGQGAIAVDTANNRILWTRDKRGPSIGNDCATLTLEGISGWRLPIIAEYASLAYMAGTGCPVCNAAIDQAAFISPTSSKNFWSNTYFSGFYSTENYCTGKAEPGDSTKAYYFYCVHDPL